MYVCTAVLMLFDLAGLLAGLLEDVSFAQFGLLPCH